MNKIANYYVIAYSTILKYPVLTNTLTCEESEAIKLSTELNSKVTPHVLFIVAVNLPDKYLTMYDNGLYEYAIM